MPPFDRPTVRWPDRDLLAERRVTTPLPAVSLTRLRQSAQSSAVSHAVRRLSWQPLVAWPDLRPVVETVCDAGAVGITCHRLQEAFSAVAARSPSVTILLPPVVGVGPERAAELAETATVSIVVDHFAQAERLATACAARSSSIDLLLRIDVGRERLGIRPGPDLHDLARGVAALQGVRLAGIAVEATTVAASGVSELSHRELSRLLERCRASLDRAGLVTNVVSISRLDDVADDDDGVGKPCRTATHARTPLDGADRPFVVLAGVVGRPTRHQAVIDAGRDWIGEAASVVWPGGRQVRLTAVDEAFSVLHVPAAGHGLVIGDVVVLMPQRGVRPRCGTMLVEDDGRWRCIPVETPPHIH